MQRSASLVLESALATALAVGLGVAPPVEAQAPSISIADVSVTEAGGGTATATFTVTLSAVSSCAASTETPTETFGSADQPYSVSTSSGVSLQTPWGYDRAANSSRKYPLVISTSSGFFSAEARQKYPFFFMSLGGTDEAYGASLAGLIEEIEQEFRIDTNRLYLAGFSVGGSGSYNVARGYYNASGGLFAGIVRMAGQSQTTLPDRVVEKTSIWYHIGLTDTALRVQIAQQAYAFIKSHPSNAAALETTETDSISGYQRTTKTLTKGGIAIMKMSEYVGMGHQPPPMDPELFDWLFSQSLICR